MDLGVHRMIKNISALSLIQLTNALIPLIILPHLIRVLGPENYGNIIYVQSIMLLLVIIVEFGFSTTVTRHISRKRNIDLSISIATTNTLFIQFVLLLTVSIALLCFGMFVGMSVEFFCGIGILLGQAAQPIWLFQGIEKLGRYSIAFILSKLFTLPLMYVFVNTTDDVNHALLIFSVSSVFTSIALLTLLVMEVKIKAEYLNLSYQLKLLNRSKSIFFSLATISTYTGLIPIAIGLIGGYQELASFNIAERIKSAIQSLVRPISLAFFPRIVWLLKGGFGNAVSIMRTSAILQISITFLIGLIVSFFSADIVFLFSGLEINESIFTLRIMALIPFFASISTIIGTQIMLPLGKNKQFFLCIFGGGCISILFMCPVISKYGAIGTGCLMIIVEIIISFLMIVWLARHNR